MPNPQTSRYPLAVQHYRTGMHVPDKGESFSFVSTATLRTLTDLPQIKCLRAQASRPSCAPPVPNSSGEISRSSLVQKGIRGTYTPATLCCARLMTLACSYQKQGSHQVFVHASVSCFDDVENLLASLLPLLCKEWAIPASIRQQIV